MRPMQVPVNNIEVLYGVSVSFPHPKVSSTDPFKVTENKKYKRILSIKPSPFDNFCVVTLARPVNFDDSNTSPLCLTKEPIKEFDEIKGKGKIVGFGYNEDFHTVFNSDADKHRMNQRHVKEFSNVDIRSTTNCQFDEWDREKSSFAMKRQVHSIGDQYMWLEM